MRPPVLATAFAALWAMLLLGGCSSQIPVAAAPHRLDLGIAGDAVATLAEQRVHVKYGVVWVGAWNLDRGWSSTEEALERIVAANTTPLVHFYYWGDDLSPECFEHGCVAGTSTKSQEGWWQLADEFGEVARRSIGDHELVIVVESEFNKNDMHASQPLDLALANITTFLRAQLPQARFVLGFGNWGDGFWRGFDQAAAASDAVGLQAMRATTVDDPAAYVSIAERTLGSARILQDEFGKPVFLHDVALSSYPEPDGLALQEQAMRSWVDLAPALSDAGVEAFVYRAYWDTPGSDGYFDEAEQHWGLAWSGNQTAKPALDEWISLAEASAAPVG
jgi:hypothetical protein